MRWEIIREHYAALLAEAQRSGSTQTSVARAGGLSGQNAISKLLANDKLGPSVETFVKAVKGLGKDLTTFFAEIEGHDRQAPALPPALSLSDRLQELERTLGAHLLATARASEPPASVPRQHGRSPHAESALSGPSVVHHTTIGLGLHHFEALVNAQVDLLQRHFEGLTDRLARDLEKDREAHRRAARPRARGRTRHRKTA